MASLAYDGNSHIINAFGRPEDWEMDTIISFIRDKGLLSGIALDVGANIGMLGMLFSEHYEKVYCFEPHPKVFNLLTFNQSRPEIRT